MKTLIAALLLLPVVAVACPNGTTPFKDTCVVELEPYKATPVKPSDELPPDDKMPSYQREGVVIVNAVNTSDRDKDADKAKEQADREGKHAAGIPGY